MKSWFHALPVEARFLAAALGGFSTLIVLYALLSIASMLFVAVDAISTHKPQISRLLGYELAAEELEAAAMKAKVVTKSLFFTADSGDRAGAALQQLLREYAEEAGLLVTGSQLDEKPLDDDPEEDEEQSNFNILTVSLALEGEPMELDAFLSLISAHRPRVAVVSMDIQRPRSSRRADKSRPKQWLNIRLNAVALRAPTE